MIKVEGNTITMTRGDTLVVTLTLKNADGTAYTPVEGDAVRFAMKRNFNDAQCVIEKTISTADMTLTLASNDTKKLPQPSKYVYDMQITKSDGTVDTFISDYLFIKEEVN